MISRLTAAINCEHRMRQVRAAQQTRFVRGAPDRINRFVLEQKNFIGAFRMLVFIGNDLFLKCECVLEIDPAKPGNSQIGHICFAPGTPIRADSCALKWVKPIARASAASASGVSVKPRSARTMNAT